MKSVMYIIAIAVVIALILSLNPANHMPEPNMQTDAFMLEVDK